ncbi:MAG: cytochrome oxidase biogenesis protein CtaA [Pedosphaera sp.]|nr:cytochrome oxidase biogenesis protein CtaA [Pedosphaera sp.]
MNGVWRHRFAVFTAASTLLLICLGGFVTSKGFGMAVPDWPTTYGYNMFFFPISKWWGVGGVHDEHLHRLVASTVGFLVILLAVWTELSEGRRWLRALAWTALALVLVQGLLGGLRVILNGRGLLGTTAGVVFGMCHAALAQIFFSTLAAIALFTSRIWSCLSPGQMPRRLSSIPGWTLVITFLILAQLLIAAAIRHQHAPLAIPDFPLAYGHLYPPTDPDFLLSVNQRRVNVLQDSEVTAFQIHLQMAHRFVAALILSSVLLLGWRLIQEGGLLGRFGAVWSGLTLVQVGLGAATIWTNKSADIATAHVAVGALTLMTGVLLAAVTQRMRGAWLEPLVVDSIDVMDVRSANSLGG